MPVELYRIDDRLIHGQVVVGWGQPLDIRLLILVDDLVAGSEWEQELYRMAVPPEMEIRFESRESAVSNYELYSCDQRRSILVAPDIGTMRDLVARVPKIGEVNLGGLHYRAGRTEKLRYIFLTPEEEATLRDLEASGVVVTAQDVPSAHPVPLSEILSEGKQA